MHSLLDMRGAIPAIINISNGKMHEVNVLDFLPIETSAFFVTLGKNNMDARKDPEGICRPYKRSLQRQSSMQRDIRSVR